MDRKQMIEAMGAQGLTWREIASRLGLTRQGLDQWIKYNGGEMWTKTRRGVKW